LKIISAKEPVCLWESKKATTDSIITVVSEGIHFGKNKVLLHKALLIRNCLIVDAAITASITYLRFQCPGFIAGYY
jgi:hypothetical protein